MTTLRRNDGSIDYDFYRARAHELRSATLKRWIRTAWQLCRAALTACKGAAMRTSTAGWQAGLRSGF
jgi:hypothetical protein